MPGDVLEVQVTEIKKSHAFATITKILKPSADRIEPVCEIFGQCGGCTFQNVSYPRQLSEKNQIVLDHLRKWITPNTEIQEIQSSPQPFNYRNKIQLKKKGSVLGFYRRKTHEIIDVQKCPIAEDSLNQKLREIRKKNIKTEFIELALDEKLNAQVIESNSEETAFSQVNRFVNATVIETLLSWIKDDQFQACYDLYAGSGNLTFPVYRTLSKIPFFAVEANISAVDQALEKIKKSRLPDLDFYACFVEQFLARFVLENQSLVILDPPRSGCGPDVLRILKNCRAKTIIYLSCNPATLQRDLAAILTAPRLRLSKVKAFDMFPQTDHVETLVRIDSEFSDVTLEQ